MVDAVRGPAWQDLWGDVTFSADGAHVAYLAQEITGGMLRRRTTYRAVQDGRPGRSFDEFKGSATFSPDGRLAFAARSGEAWSIVVDDEPGPSFNWVLPPVWSASGRLGYVAGTGAAVVVVVDGVIGPPLISAIDFQGRFVTFSPDGRHVVYFANVAEGLQVVVDGRPGPLVQGVDHPVFDDRSVSFLGLKGRRVVRLRIPFE